MKNQTAYLLSALESIEREGVRGSVFAGFDGFVDEIIEAVQSRSDVNQYQSFTKITDFADKIKESAGKSCNIELLPKMAKIGGNGPILSLAMAEQNIAVTYAGALGYPLINPVFAKLVEKCRVISFAEPGHTQALEFTDGKIMLGKMVQLSAVNWENLIAATAVAEIKKELSGCKILCMVNWTMLPEMNSLYEGFIYLLTEIERKPEIFIDLTDPAKRTSNDILGALELIMKMQKITGVILGLNEEESLILARLLGETEKQSTVERAEFLRRVLGLKIVFIHPLKTAAASNGDTAYEIKGPFTAKPVLTTGAGDNFNAGFLSAYLRGLELAECLITGVCTSGFYVRNGRSPSLPELISFMEKWAELQCGDF